MTGLDESRKFDKGYYFWGSLIFMDLFFEIRFCLVFILWGMTKIPGPININLRVHCLGPVLSNNLND